MNVLFVAKDPKQQLPLQKQQPVQKPQATSAEQTKQEPVFAVYVDTKEKLISEAKIWNSCPELGIDIECENNLHHYGAYISIIQISSKDKNWVVDIIKLGQIQPLIDVFKNKNIIKIFHDVSFDFRILKKQFNCIPQNVFDTQLAAILLGKHDLGLGSLLHEYFDVKKESKFQMADWTKRPLTPEMINYAIRDTNHLIGLKEVLRKELMAKGRLSWLEEETALINDRDFDYKEGDFFSIKGISKLSGNERAILKKLSDIRELLAKKVNRPVHFIISTGRMVEIAKAPPTLTEWANMKGVHPIVRSKARMIYEEILIAKKTELKLPRPAEKKHYSQKQKDEFEKYNVIRDNISEKLGLQKHVVLSKEQIKDIVLTGKYDSLRNWQKPLVMHEVKK
jgi:ribonuclease D